MVNPLWVMKQLVFWEQCLRGDRLTGLYGRGWMRICKTWFVTLWCGEGIKIKEDWQLGDVSRDYYESCSSKRIVGRIRSCPLQMVYWIKFVSNTIINFLLKLICLHWSQSLEVGKNGQRFVFWKTSVTQTELAQWEHKVWVPLKLVGPCCVWEWLRAGLKQAEQCRQLSMASPFFLNILLLFLTGIRPNSTQAYINGELQDGFFFLLCPLVSNDFYSHLSSTFKNWDILRKRIFVLFWDYSMTYP